MSETKETSNLPEKAFRIGAISATVWRNTIRKKDGSEAEVRSITFKRSYQDKDGAWKDSNSLRTMDLPKAALVLNKAYEYIMMSGREDMSVEA
jgi:hypothetical protein